MVPGSGRTFTTGWADDGMAFPVRMNATSVIYDMLFLPISLIDPPFSGYKPPCRQKKYKSLIPDQAVSKGPLRKTLPRTCINLSIRNS
jgi:hypothetical protein